MPRRRAVIVDYVTLVGAAQVFGTTKSGADREVPIPRFLIDDLGAPDEFVFPGPRSGRPLRPPVFRRSAFDAAAASIGRPGLHLHELRHTAASLAIASGADIKVVQAMLGHASAGMTLDQYGHLFGDRLDDVADRMAAARQAAVAHLLPEAKTRVLSRPRTRPKPNNSGPFMLVPPAGFEPAPPPPEGGALSPELRGRQPAKLSAVTELVRHAPRALADARSV